MRSLLGGTTGCRRQPSHARVIASCAATALVLVLASSAQATTFTAVAKPQVDPTGGLPSAVTGVAVGDLDGDLDADVASDNGGDGSLSALINDGTGTLTAMPGSIGAIFASTANAIAVGDLNGDGANDVAAVSNGASGDLNLHLFIKNALGTYDQTDLATGANPSSVKIADLNGDGKADLAVTGLTDDTLTLLFQDPANPTVYTPTTLTTGGHPLSVAIGDLDGDTLPDIAVANNADNDLTGGLGDSVSVFSSTAPGAYPTTPTTVPLPFVAPQPHPAPSSIAIADLNGDGDARPDLVLADQTSNSVTVLTQDAAGGFSPASMPAGAGPIAIATGDLDGDGRNDIVVANQTSADLTVLLKNAGDPGYTSTTILDGGGIQRSVALADLTGDGKLDIVVARSTFVTVMVNTPSPVISLSPTTGAFGNVAVGATSAAQTFTVTNSGTAPLTVSGVTLAGAAAAQYTIATNTCDAATPIAIGGQCSVAVAFHPTSAGAQPATLDVASDAVSAGSVALTGTGATPAVVSLSATTGAFPDTLLGATSDAQTVIVTNSGQATLHISDVTLTGDDPSQFSLGANDCAPGTAIVAGGHCSVAVTFTPTSAGAHAASLRIASDAASSPDLVALSGTGVAPVEIVPVVPPVADVPAAPVGVPTLGSAPAPPSNVVTFTKVTAGSKGAITIVLKLPGAGRFTLATTAKVPGAKARKGKKPKKATTVGYGSPATGVSKGASTVTIRVTPGKRAASALKAHRKLRVTIEVRFAPTGGTKGAAKTSVTAKST